MSDTPQPKAPPAPKSSMADRGRRVARYVLALVTAILVVDAVFGEKGLLALLKARRDFEGVEASLVTARAAVGLMMICRSLPCSTAPASDKILHRRQHVRAGSSTSVRANDVASRSAGNVVSTITPCATIVYRHLDLPSRTTTVGRSSRQLRRGC